MQKLKQKCALRRICKVSRRRLPYISILLIERPTESKHMHPPQVTPSQSAQYRYGTTYSSSSFDPGFAGSNVNATTSYIDLNINYAPTYPAITYAHPLPFNDSRYSYNTWSLGDPILLTGQRQFSSFRGQNNGYIVNPESTDVLDRNLI